MAQFFDTDITHLLDLTSLGDNDDIHSIIRLCDAALNNPLSPVAAVCVFNRFIPDCKRYFTTQKHQLKVATVINFPSGDTSVKDTLVELETALKNGADEIDAVIPYKHLADDTGYIINFLRELRNNCPITLKIILETGEIIQNNLIKLACKIAIEAGADFLKTSTGKVPKGADLLTSSIMLEEIKAKNVKCGFKASGGIKNKNIALDYINLACNILGSSYITNKTFRLGASSLLESLINNQSSSR